jgi:hypothetical protein
MYPIIKYHILYPCLEMVVGESPQPCRMLTVEDEHDVRVFGKEDGNSEQPHAQLILRLRAPSPFQNFFDELM